jgi:N6-L-threonylcarbamoyladenine synthase
MQNLNIRLLAIESSCDDTSCAVLHNDHVLSNVTAGQKVHAAYGGVIPELASRDHQKNIVHVADAALRAAGVDLNTINAIAVTSGPGLMGSLLVGLSFAKSLSLALKIPLVGVNHMQAHILAHFIRNEPGTGSEREVPSFPFLCLTVSGGHTQIVKVESHLRFELLGRTIDDAVGEAFDKAAKLLGLPYPGGPLIDKLAQEGDAGRFTFAETRVPGYDYSFSGIKTSFLYFLQDNLRRDPGFIKSNLRDICASYQRHLVSVLLKNLRRVVNDTGIRCIAVAGGVSANSELRRRLLAFGEETGSRIFIPPFEYCTDNAAMIGIAGYYRYLAGETSGLELVPQVRMSL